MHPNLCKYGWWSTAGGITSQWFCFESTLLALAISSTAGLFLLNRTTKNARRMFHASLLYLPVFMGGLLVHRRSSDNEQSLAVENSNQLSDFSSSSSIDGELTESSTPQKNRRPVLSRPPVAYASVAPFPFLPAPYVSNWVVRDVQWTKMWRSWYSCGEKFCGVCYVRISMVEFANWAL